MEKMSTVQFSLNTSDNSGGYSCAGVSNTCVEKNDTRVKQEVNKLFASDEYKNMTHRERTMQILAINMEFS